MCTIQNTNYITRQHLKLSYQIILSSIYEHSINLVSPFLFSFHPLDPSLIPEPSLVALTRKSFWRVHILSPSSDCQRPPWVSKDLVVFRVVFHSQYVFHPETFSFVRSVLSTFITFFFYLNFDTFFFTCSP